MELNFYRKHFTISQIYSFFFVYRDFAAKSSFARLGTSRHARPHRRGRIKDKAIVILIFEFLTIREIWRIKFHSEEQLSPCIKKKDGAPSLI